jgi:hypothetical protein
MTMSLNRLFLCIISLFATSCSNGQLSIICDTPMHLKEISAIEYDAKRDVFWVIQDSGNSNELIALDRKGSIAHTVELKDIKNKDWEDLTKDAEGNLYIGDFGNNNKSRNKYSIYKLDESELDLKKVRAKRIEFKLPKGEKEEDFEGFFVFEQHFYLFTKNAQKTDVYRLPNNSGKHRAEKIGSYKFEGKGHKVTSAAINAQGTVVVLLNSDRLWKLSNFKGDQFFSGDIKALEFNHSSQKEGIGFLNETEVLISDERDGINGGNIYSFQLH